jgi:hypothetical protein
MQLQQLKHYNPCASSGFQSSIDCGNLNFSSLLKNKTYRSTSCIDKLLETVLGAITDSQTRFYVQRFCMLWVWIWRYYSKASNSEILILIVSAVANPCKIKANCQVQSVSLYYMHSFCLSNMSTHSYKDPNPTQIIFQRENKRNFVIASGCLRMNAQSTG